VRRDQLVAGQRGEVQRQNDLAVRAHGGGQYRIIRGGLRKQNIKDDGFRARHAEPLNQSGVDISGPGPLPELVQALFINGHQRNVLGYLGWIGGNEGVVKPEVQALWGIKGV
jgi:hypothetical protein